MYKNPTEEAVKLLLAGEWDSLFQLAVEWTKQEPSNPVPQGLLITGTLFMNPPKLDNAESIIAKIEKENLQQPLITWLEEAEKKLKSENLNLSILKLFMISFDEPDYSTEQLEELYRIYPESPELLFSLGLSWGGTYKAINYHQKLIGIRPDFINAYYYISVNYNELGVSDKDLEYLEKTLELDPKHLLALWQMGNYYQSLGNKEKAKHYYQKVVDISPESDPAKKSRREIEKINKSYCFIATAAIGTNNNPLINELRMYRDNYLVNTTTGSLFLKIYSIVSPLIANIIQKSEILRWITFTLLIKPFAYLCRMYRSTNNKELP